MALRLPGKSKSPTLLKRTWSPNQIKHIWECDGGSCIYCGSPAQDIDHVIPVTKGGFTRVENGVCCCKSCNHEKYNALTQNYLTRAIFWLLSKGEDMSWMDTADSDEENI